jgi:hypothetical protein
MANWLPTDCTHDGGVVFRHRITGEMRYEALQERRLFALPARAEADIRRRLDDGER